MKTALLSLVLLCLVGAGVENASADCSLESLWKQARRSVSYAEPDPAETALALELFRGLLKGERSEALRDLALRAGMEWREFRGRGESWILLSEPEDGRRGRGVYLFPVRPVQGPVLMIPHGFSDLETDEIGLRLARRGGWAAVAWNSAHRRDRDGREGGDLAHLERSWFTALSEAAAGVLPASRAVIQLHGFDAQGREDRGEEPGRILVSSGTALPSAAALALSQCLRVAGIEGVGLYPEQGRGLGGTTNVTGRILRGMGHPGFLHIEMSLELRRALGRAEPPFEGFAACLERGGS